LTFQFDIIKVDKMKNVVTISVEANNSEENRVLDAVVMVQPPVEPELEITLESEGETYE